MIELLQSQIPFLLAFQDINGLTGLAEFFTFLGREEFFLLLLPLVYLCIDSGIGARLAFILLLGDSLNGVVKLLFHLPRPYWIDSRVQPLSTGTSYGLPSGHAQNGVSVWFFLAGVLRRPWGWTGAAVVVLLISFSRAYLGVHFPSDVVGGWIIGGLFLLTYLKIEPIAKDWLGRQPVARQIGAAFIASLALVLVSIAARLYLNGVPDPDLWAAFAVDARSLAGVISDAGALFGIGAGWALTTRWARFNAGGPILKRLARFLIGLTTVGVIYFGLRALFPQEPEALGLTLRYIRYAFLGWTVIFAVPWAMLKLGLASAGE